MKQELSSGATVEVSVASFSTGWKLATAVIMAFKVHGIELKIGEKINMESLLKDNLSNFVGGFLDIITSESVLGLLFDCGKSAIYTKNGVSQKISQDVFEPVENRADFLEAMYIVAKENLEPFFPKALTSLKETPGQTTNTATKS